MAERHGHGSVVNYWAMAERHGRGSVVNYWAVAERHGRGSVVNAVESYLADPDVRPAVMCMTVSEIASGQNCFCVLENCHFTGC